MLSGAKSLIGHLKEGTLVHSYLLPKDQRFGKRNAEIRSPGP